MVITFALRSAEQRRPKEDEVNALEKDWYREKEAVWRWEWEEADWGGGVDMMWTR